MTESFIGSDLALLAFATNSVQIFSVQMEKFHRTQIEFFFWLLTLLGTDDDRWQKLKLNSCADLFEFENWVQTWARELLSMGVGGCLRNDESN